MREMSYVKRIIIAAMCIAFCVVLPIAFHAIPNAGNIFCPMHIPVLLCGLICGGGFGIVCGITGPFLASIITSMPPMAYLPGMMAELVAYGVITGIMMRFIHTKRLYVDLYISLVTGMLVGRVIAGATKALIFVADRYSIALWVTAYFVTAWPGIVIQLVLIPAIVFALEKAKLISLRYPNRAVR